MSTFDDHKKYEDQLNESFESIKPKKKLLNEEFLKEEVLEEAPIIKLGILVGGALGASYLPLRIKIAEKFIKLYTLKLKREKDKVKKERLSVKLKQAKSALEKLKERTHHPIKGALKGAIAGGAIGTGVQIGRTAVKGAKVIKNIKKDFEKTINDPEFLDKMNNLMNDVEKQLEEEMKKHTH